MQCTQDMVTERIKYIEGAYYIEVTEESKMLFGETIIKSVMVKIDIEWVLHDYLVAEGLKDYLEGWYRNDRDCSKIIQDQGVGKVFESIVNDVLGQEHKIQINTTSGVVCLVVNFTNGKEMFISNSEWGEVSAKSQD